MASSLLQPAPVLDFWFSDRAKPLWFEPDAAFDSEIRARFGPAVGQAQAGGFQDWRRGKRGALALVILLDQMARNIHRGEALAFAGDARARAVADKAIAAGLDRAFDFSARRFLYLPFEHSEDPGDHTRSLALFSQLAMSCAPEDRAEAAEQLRYAQQHADIIQRFGRYPHRNLVLGRASTPEEREFLAGPDSSF
jgi:uncharacterized protein (DUF924 family)